MSATQCPHCKKHTPAGRPECLACGASLAPAIKTATKAITPTPKEFACPKCKSTHISGNKKGFGVGKALVGGVLAGGIGLLGGFIGSRKIENTCMQCGHAWDAGKK